MFMFELWWKNFDGEHIYKHLQTCSNVFNVSKVVQVPNAGACRGVRCEAAVSPTISATSLLPTVSATPEFEVPQTCRMIDYWMILG